jgi:hypothetical protein
MLADLALEFKVEAFLYSTRIPGGSTPDVSHKSKLDNEEYCRQLGKEGLNWMLVAASGVQTSES